MTVGAWVWGIGVRKGSDSGRWWHTQNPPHPELVEGRNPARTETPMHAPPTPLPHGFSARVPSTSW